MNSLNSIRNIEPCINKRSTAYYSIMRSEKRHPPLCGHKENENDARYGDFVVSNENNNPDVVYYFVEIRNPGVTTSRSGRDLNNNGRDEHNNSWNYTNH